MARRKTRKKDAGNIIFQIIGIELIILIVGIIVGGIIVIPPLFERFSGPVSSFLNRGKNSSVSEENINPAAQQDEPVPVNEPVKQDPVSVPEEELATIRLIAAGDNRMSRSSTLSGKNDDGTYSFYNHFVNISDLFRSADIAVISQDTVLAGEAFGVSDGESWNSVFEVSDSLSDAGIGVVLAANDHILDQGSDGLNNMINYIHTNHPGMILAGVNQSRDQQNTPVYADVSGIRLSIINYTCRSNRTEPLDHEPYLVNLDNEEWLSGIVQAASESADFIIAFPHWGESGSPEVTDEQRHEAQLLADLGVDLVIGSYPGVVGPAEWLTGKNGNETFVYYSLGNFQTTDEKTENILGCLANVTITKTDRRTYLSNCGMDFVVTHYAQRMSSDYYDIVTTFPWSAYNAELASQHGIRSWDPEFSYEHLDTLRREALNRFEYRK